VCKAACRICPEERRLPPIAEGREDGCQLPPPPLPAPTWPAWGGGGPGGGRAAPPPCTGAAAEMDKSVRPSVKSSSLGSTIPPTSFRVEGIAESSALPESPPLLPGMKGAAFALKEPPGMKGAAALLGCCWCSPRGAKGAYATLRTRGVFTDGVERAVSAAAST